MIGWENDRGAYFIHKLQDKLASVETIIGKLSDLTTTAKTSIVGAINEVDGNADSANSHIGTLSNLLTTAKDNIVAAVNEVFGMANNVKITNPVSMEEGFTATVLAAYKQGKIVVMTYQFSVANVTANTNTKIGTIASAHMPVVEQYYTGMIGAYANSGTPCKFMLKDDGSIMISVPTNVGESAVAVRGTFIYASV